MAYVKYEGADTKYQGTSFTRTLTKKDGSLWASNETATYKMVDSDGTEVDTGILVKSVDNTGLIFEVGKTTTATFLGEYKLVVYLEDTVNLEYSEAIAKYTITYTDILGQ